MRRTDPTLLVRPTVLVAEPDDGLRGVLEGWLSQHDYRVVAVEDGQQIFDYLALAARSAGRVPFPRLVLCEVELAGCSGLATCLRLRARARQLPVVMITAANDVVSQRAALLAGACDLIRKPLHADEVLGTVALFS